MLVSHFLHAHSFDLILRHNFSPSVGFAWQDFGSRKGYDGGFSDNLAPASPMSESASARQLQHGHTTGQGLPIAWW